MTQGVGGARHRVGCHKHSAHDDAAAAQVRHEEGRIKAMPAEQAHKQGKRSQHRDRNVERNTAHKPQVDAAEQHTRYGTADDIIGKAKKCRQNVNRPSRRQLRQRRGAGNAVHRVPGHDAAERDQQEAPCRKGRVHKVLAQAAKQALHHQNGKHCADDRDIQRYACGQAQSQQQTCHSGAAVLCCNGLSDRKAEQGFRHNR